MQQSRTTSGFTLIEMIVSLGVFSVVVTIAVGALLVLIAANRQLQDEQSILSNLAFALDSMTREIRTGTQYYCESHNNNTGTPGRIFNPSYDIDAQLPPDDVQDCYDGRSPNSHRFQGVAFVEGGDSITGASANRILYFFDQNDNTIYRRVGGTTGADSIQPIVSDGIFIINAEFFVSGSAPLLDGPPADQQQATVTISIEASASDPALAAVPVKRHRIQTTVTQRTLDI